MTYDIEISPKVGFYYNYESEARIIKMHKDWEIMSISWKWLGEEEVFCLTTENMSEKKLLKEFLVELNKAHVVVGHNVDKFDNKKLNTRLIKHNLPLPEPYESVDTLKIAKGKFSFTSNRLKDLGEFLGLGTKCGSHADLWYDCLFAKGEKKKEAWEKMIAYNKQDTILTEMVYLKLRPHSKTHVNLAKYGDDPETMYCHYCGSENLRRRGFKPKASRWRQEYSCNDCSSRSYGKKTYPVKPIFTA